MGDKIGKAIDGTLYFIKRSIFQYILTQKIDQRLKAKIIADLCRLNTLYMISNSGSGHIGSSFSSLDIFSWLFLKELDFNNNNLTVNGDIFFSSKGHDAPGFYSMLIAHEYLDFDLIDKLRKINGLPGHPDINTPCVATNTGSLGMGISKAKGMILARRLSKISGRVFVLTGDGELQEGQFWESLVSAANYNMDELFVIVDHNKLQSDTLLSEVSDLGDILSKVKSFGWNVDQCDGNNIESLENAINRLKETSGPKFLLANTIKGKGVSFMEHTAKSNNKYYQYHSGAPTSEEYLNAANELIGTIEEYQSQYSLDSLYISSVEKIKKKTLVHKKPDNLITAYSELLVEHAKKNNKIVALDADLILDTGLIPFKNKFPERFIECGIAEQDMVSTAGGLSLSGYLPVVHSFSCFLSTRPNEQIYNNATERKKIIYVGSLAGVIPGGPGHSHQAVRDISSLGAIPGLRIVEPCCEEELKNVLNWAFSPETEYSTYIRLCSIPTEINFNYPKDIRLNAGKGLVIDDGEEIAIIAYGPVACNLAHSVAIKYKTERHINIKVINFPWLNEVKRPWLKNYTEKIKFIIVLENHYLIGGLRDRITSIDWGINPPKIVAIGLDDFPKCGENELVLKHANLDSFNLIFSIEKYLHENGK